MRLLPPMVAMLLAMAFSPPPAQAAEDFDSCTDFITETPISIAQPGTWCMTEDLVHVGGSAAISVEVPGVTIDCNHFALDGTGLPTDNGVYGIYGWTTAPGVTVRHCDIRGFMFGILLYSGGLIEDNLIQRTLVEAIYIDGPGQVLRNRIRDIGGSTGGFQWAYGIVSFGDVDIIDNEISGVRATPEGGWGATGIIANEGDPELAHFVISGNTIRDLVPDGDGQAIGISTYSQGALVIRDNVVYGSGQASSIGIYCLWQPDTAIRGNILFDFGYPLWNCIADSGNSIKP